MLKTAIIIEQQKMIDQVSQENKAACDDLILMLLKKNMLAIKMALIRVAV